MAYPVKQFQQPSNPSFIYSESPYNSPAPHTSSRALHRDDATTYNSYDRSYPNPSPHQQEGSPGARSSSPSREKPQRFGLQASWGQVVQQPEFKWRGDSRDEQCRPGNRHDLGDYPMNVQYGAMPSPGKPHHQDQDYRWDGYDSSDRLTGDYDSPGALLPRNANHGFQDPRVRHAGPRTYDASTEQRSPDGMIQEQPSGPPSDRKTANTGMPSHYGELSSQVARKPRAPNPTGDKPRKSAKERILMSPTSPGNISWDNPFPTFPSSKKRTNGTEDEELSRPMGHMILDQRVRAGVPEESKVSTRGGQMCHNSPRNVSLPFVHGGGTTLEPVSMHTMQGVSGFPQSMQRTEGQHHSTNKLRPQTEHGRHSEDTARGPSLHGLAARSPDDERSRTMPAIVTATFASPISRGNYEQKPSTQASGPNPGARHDRAPMENLLHQHPRRPMQPHSCTTDALTDHGRVNYELQTPHPQSYHSQQASIGEVFDSYYHSPHHSSSSFAQGYVEIPRSPRDEDMPVFDSRSGSGDGHSQGMTIDDHLRYQQSSNVLPPISADAQLGVASGSQFLCSRSKSSPNLQKQSLQGSQQYSDGFDFELPGSVPAMYTASPPSDQDNYFNTTHGDEALQPHHTDRQHTNTMNWSQVSTRYQQPSSRPTVGEVYGRLAQSRSSDGQSQSRAPRASPSHEYRRGNARKGLGTTNCMVNGSSPPIGQLTNPDALPAHPAPVRAGVMTNAPSNQPPRPRPVRQYTIGSAPRTESPSSPRPQISRVPREESKPASVTPEGLERLRQTTRRNPSDNKIQLLLAKKLVEAASALADEDGRADQRITARNRERYNSEAYKLVKRLAQNIYPDAIFYLGDCYTRGSLGLQTDPKEAFSHYQSAAKGGHAQAAYRVAVCCEMGLDEGGGTKRDAVKAMQWYQRAATLGDTPAMYKLGVIQLKGLLGQPKNASAALSWLQRAAAQADKENPHALHELALLYEVPSSTDGIRQDAAYAKQLFIEAANLGYKFSQFRLGCTFEYGLLECPVDPRQSIAWYSKAAVQDEHQSELALSGWYLTGSEGVLQQSDTEAYLWARKAAQAGLAKAEYAMGYFTEVGIGAPANIEDAKRWYWRSASQNFPKARERLEDLRRGGAKMQKTRVSRSKMNKQSEGECTVM